MNKFPRAYFCRFKSSTMLPFNVNSKKRKREDDDDDVVILEERPRKILKIDPAQCLLILEEYGKRHEESVFHLEVYIFKRRWYRSVVRHTGIALYHHNTDQWWIHEVNLNGALTKLTTKEELTSAERYIIKACDIVASLDKIQSILFNYQWSYRFSTNNCRDHVRFVLERLKSELNIEILPEAEKWIKRIQLRDNAIAFVVGQIALKGLGVSFPVGAAVTGTILLAKELRKKSLPDLKKVVLDHMHVTSNDTPEKAQNDRHQQEIEGKDSDRTEVNVNDGSRFSKIVSLIRHKLK